MNALATARAKANAAAAIVSRLTIELERAQQAYREAHTRALETTHPVPARLERNPTMNDEILRLTVRRNGAFTTVDSAVGSIHHGTRYYGGHDVAGQGRGEALRETMKLIRRLSPGARGPLAWPHRAR